MPESLSAGGVVVRCKDGHAWVALVREGDLPDLILPKGRVEPGESLEAAARREIYEEAGLTDLELVAELGRRERLNFRRDRWSVTVYFLFRTRQTEGHPADQKHRYRCEWHRIDRLPAMFWQEQRQLIEENRQRIEAMAAEAPCTCARSRRPPA